jgi:hypothetical protein
MPSKTSSLIINLSLLIYILQAASDATAVETYRRIFIVCYGDRMARRHTTGLLLRRSNSLAAFFLGIIKSADNDLTFCRPANVLRTRLDFI